MNGGFAAVTGASGFVGSHLVDALVAAGSPTRAVVRGTSDTRWLPAAAERFVASLDDRDGLARAIRDASVVFHLAAVTSAWRHEAYTHTNLDGTRRLLEVVHRWAPGARVVLCSSLAAIGPARDEHPLNESDVPRPLSAYGRSKLEGERLAEAFAADHGLDIVIVRPGAVYGPRDRDILAAFRLAGRGLALRLSAPNQRLAMVHAADLAQAMVLVAHRAPRIRGVARRYHISDGTAPTWASVNAAIAAAVGRRVRAVAIPRLVALTVAEMNTLMARIGQFKPLLTCDRITELAAADWSCDITRAREELAFSPGIHLEAGMSETAAWYRAQGWL